jgi:adenine-specific DNA-methyltransferase
LGFTFEGKNYSPGSKNHWKTTIGGMRVLALANRIQASTNSIQYIRFFDDFAIQPILNLWTDTTLAGFVGDKIYVVQTVTKVIERCILMTTDPGDLVLDPTCGSGTTAYVAEQWGRRWITIDTSRVALALARARIMGARYPYYLLADSREGQRKEAELSGRVWVEKPTYGNVRHGFVYERVPHITLKSIANNAEIDIIWEKWQQKLRPLRERLNAALGTAWQEWEIPRDLSAVIPAKTAIQQEVKDSTPPSAGVTKEIERLHSDLWEARIARQKEIDASIAAKAELEHLYDKPYEDKKKVRVAGPFTFESLSPHRVLGVDENDELIDPLKLAEDSTDYAPGRSFEQMILENLKTAGVQQAHQDDRITFTAIAPWPGDMVCAEGRYREGDSRSAPPSSSAPSSAPSAAPTSSPPLARRAMRGSMCSSPAPSTMRHTPRSSASWAASRCSRPA